MGVLELGMSGGKHGMNLIELATLDFVGGHQLHQHWSTPHPDTGGTG